MGRGLKPDHYFPNVYAITPAFLQRRGIRAVILDIDNTLVFYRIHRPTEHNRRWIRSLREAGIAVAFVSNGYRERVEEYNREFGFYYSFKSQKPRPGGFLQAAKAMGVEPAETAVIGDQIYTDILGGNRAGMLTLLVDPIHPEPWLRFRLKRALERPVTRALRYSQTEDQP
ncbi:MAG: YqeG family HAD IIIA-type phosphatase [Clostridia bacterium]|nr:YqeG family HAD IIIA-type phosphatase [Clostridia bacterium]MBQ3077479.1 YqeG family HAD IIIA-type phosphatase [Clostridia bacterium]